MTNRRLAAIAAFVLALAAIVLGVAAAAANFPRGLLTLVFVLLALPVAWFGLLRRGVARGLAVGVGVILLVAGAALFLSSGELVLKALAVGALLAALVATRTAFSVHVHLPPAPPPKSAVLFWNPKSGGGKATKFKVEDEARARGIEPIQLKLGDDLEQLVRDAAARGADGLAMAGGDGSQAIVATVAAELDLPYACIPAGTRNHFALDLGVDRDDVVGALEAFVDGGERRVDLAEINGRVFVNNVSLGLYAEAVQKDEYRDAKLRTLLDTIPAALGPEAGDAALSWTGPDGEEQSSGAAVLVSNNAYRLGRAVGSGTRPRMDEGRLGIAVFGTPAQGAVRPPRGLTQWTARRFDVRSEAPVPAGVDGEALVFDPPLRFRMRPGVLRVRVAPAHPGASPSAAQPETYWGMVRALARMAAGR